MTRLRWEKVGTGWKAGRYVIASTDNPREFGLFIDGECVAVSTSKDAVEFLKRMAQREANR